MYMYMYMYIQYMYSLLDVHLLSFGTAHLIFHVHVLVGQNTTSWLSLRVSFCW